MNTNNLLQFLRSKVFLAAIVAVFGLSVVTAAFSAGVAVGYRKASFSYAWGENYARTFGGPRGGFYRPAGGHDFIDAHGTFGQVIKVDGSTIILRGREGVERAVVVDADTAIKRVQEDISLGDLHADDQIVVIGVPDAQGQILAKFIRVIPPMQPMQRPDHLR